MIIGGGIYLDREVAEELLNIIDLSSQVVELLEAPKHTDDTELTEVKLLNALDRAANVGLSIEFLRKVLQQGERHERQPDGG